MTRITWRPSRCVVIALAAMGGAGGWAALVSGIPDPLRIPMALASVVWGAIAAFREHRRPPRVLMFSSDGTLTLDASAIDQVHAHWRGPLPFLRMRAGDGRVHRLSFWPDTLGPRSRRALRLALEARAPGAASRRSRHEMRG